MSNQAWINLAYLTASMLFIMAFKLMTGPRTAVRGNYLGACRYGDRHSGGLL